MEEYIALSSALRDNIPIMELLEEFANAPKVYCKAFEDNSEALEIKCSPKMHPHTKAVKVIYHHFYEHVRLGKFLFIPLQLTGGWLMSLPSP